MEAMLKQILYEIKGLKQDVGDMKQDVNNLTTRVDGMEARQNEMYCILRGLQENASVTRAMAINNEEKLNYLEGSSKRQEGKTNSIEISINSILRWTKSKEESDNETTKYLLEKVSQHDIELRLLKNKLINY